MLSILLFVFYFIVFSLILMRSKKIGQSGPGSMVLFAAFAFKVLLGCLYGYLFMRYYGGDDTWAFHHQSLPEYQQLIHHPVDFIKDFLPFPAFSASHNFMEGMHFYIMDLETHSLLKLLAFFDIFSRGNYYINVVFFDFLVFFGPLLLFKLLSRQFPAKKKLLTVALFFIPSITFWLSGIRSEGMILLSMAMAIYYCHKWFLKSAFIYLILMVAGLTGMMIFRTQFLFTFIPAFLSWTLCLKSPRRAIYYFLLMYFLCGLVFFGSTLFSKKENFPEMVVAKQQEFFSLHGNTAYNLDTLQPTITGFAKNLPQALDNTFLRPFVWEAKGGLQMLTALGTVLSVVLLFFLIFRYEKNPVYILHPLTLMFLFYGVTQIVLIGYTVPFPGAIVRYMAIPALLLVVSLTLLIDWTRTSVKFK